MTAQVESKILLDGLVLVYDDFLFMADEQWNLPNHILIKRKYTSQFKGVKFLQEDQIYEVLLGTRNGMTLSLFLTVDMTHPLNENLVNGEVAVDFKEIRDIIVDGVDIAIDLMEDDTETKLEWKLRCCPSYDQFMNKKNRCDGCSKSKRDTNPRRKIFKGDMPTFCQLYGEFLTIAFDDKGYNWAVIKYEFGQSEEWNSAVSDLKGKINLGRAVDIVVHVAQDFTQREKILLWNRARVHKVLGARNTNDFFNYFTGGHGNFEKDVEGQAGFENIWHVKFYGDILKEVHRIDSFKDPCVSKALDSTNVDNRRDLIQLLGNVDSLLTYIETILRRRYNRARVEAVICLEDLDKGNTKRVFQEYRAAFEDKFRNVESCFRSFEFDDFAEQVKVSFIPPLLTFKDVVTEVIDRRQVNPLYSVSLGTIHLALACEMLISFFIYGNLTYKRNDRRAEKRFNKDLASHLNLKRATFNSEPIVFNGLRFTDAIDLLPDNKLKYTGILLLKDLVFPRISVEGNRVLFKKCLDILSKDLQEDEESRHQEYTDEECYQQVSNVIWNEIKEYVKSTNFKRTIQCITADDICYFMNYKPTREISVKEFVEHVFSGRYFEQPVVALIIQAVRHNSVRYSEIDFKQSFGDKVNKKIWKRGVSLLYPDSENKLTLVVLPPACNGNETFSQKPRDYQEQVAKQYKMTFFKRFNKSIECPLGTVKKVLASAVRRTWMNSRHFVNCAIHEMLVK